MRTRPMVSLTAAAGLIDAIAVRGGDVDAVLSTVGLTRQALSNPKGAIPSSDFAALLEAAALATGDDCFGLHFAEHYQPENIGPLTYVVLNSPTFADGGREHRRATLHLHNEGGAA